MVEIKQDYNILLNSELSGTNLRNRMRYIRDFDKIDSKWEYTHEIVRREKRRFLLWDYVKEIPIARIPSEPTSAEGIYKTPNNLRFDGLTIKVLDHSEEQRIRRLAEKVEDELRESVVICA
tara:strand:+ start:202 stop:564 length:363 start_codon:yes stop_codon:yes gene_type:complete